MQLPGGQFNAVELRARGDHGPQLYAVAGRTASRGGTFTITGVGLRCRRRGPVTLDGVALPRLGSPRGATRRSRSTVPAAAPVSRPPGRTSSRSRSRQRRRPDHRQRPDLPRASRHRQRRPTLQPDHLRGRPGQDLRAGGDAPAPPTTPSSAPSTPPPRSCASSANASRVRSSWSTRTSRARPAAQPARRLLREPDRLLAGQAAGRGPGQPGRRRPGLGHRRQRLRWRQPWPTDWYAGRRPRPGSATRPSTRARSISVFADRRPPSDGVDSETAPSSTASTSAAATSQLPGNINADRRRPDRPAAQRDHPGRRHLRQRLRPLPADHEQRGRRATAAPTARIRIGTPDLPAPDTNQHNENVRIANNRIVTNGGTNLAGGIGLFAGADGYEVTGNDICGNFSAEYGGGVSVYGYSPNGTIHHNRICFNHSYDEGGGIMIAGELPADPRPSRRAPAPWPSTTT